MQLENYRSRLSKDGENEQLFSEILRKLPSYSSGEKDSLSVDEKQYLLQEIKSTKRGFQTSGSMINMIFKFFLQSGEYSFFVKRLKNMLSAKEGYSEEMDRPKSSNVSRSYNNGDMTTQANTSVLTSGSNSGYHKPQYTTSKSY